MLIYVILKRWLGSTLSPRWAKHLNKYQGFRSLINTQLITILLIIQRFSICHICNLNIFKDHFTFKTRFASSTPLAWGRLTNLFTAISLWYPYCIIYYSCKGLLSYANIFFGAYPTLSTSSLFFMPSFFNLKQPVGHQTISVHLRSNSTPLPSRTTLLTVPPLVQCRVDSPERAVLLTLSRPNTQPIGNKLVLLPPKSGPKALFIHFLKNTQ